MPIIAKWGGVVCNFAKEIESTTDRVQSTTDERSKSRSKVNFDYAFQGGRKDDEVGLTTIPTIKRAPTLNFHLSTLISRLSTLTF